MSNEFIGRRGALGLGKETISGEKTSPTVWIPRLDAAGIDPKKETIADNSALGSIVDINEAHTIKEWSEVSVGGAMRQDSMGHIFNSALGKNTQVSCVSIENATGGNPAKGDVISSAAGSFDAEIKKVVKMGEKTCYFVEVTSGTLSDQVDVCGGSWSAAELTVVNGVNGHLFEVMESNNHPSYTFWENTPVSSRSAAYCMLNTLDLDVTNGDFGKFQASFIGKRFSNEAEESVDHTGSSAFLAKHANLYFADNEAGLVDAEASTANRFALSIAKNLDKDSGIALGSTESKAIYNQQLGITGSVEALYGSDDMRDYVVNDSKKACRLTLVNTAEEALHNDGEDNIYPTIVVDVMRTSFSEWGRSTDLDTVVTQNMNFQAESGSGKAIEILLVNNISTSY